MKDFSERTCRLMREVDEMYGSHTYSLAYCANGELHLVKGYVNTIAVGNREIQRTLKKLLNGEVI